VNPAELRVLVQQGLSDSEIGRRVGLSKDAIFRARKKYGLSGPVMQVHSHDEPWAENCEVTIPPRPFAVPIPAPATVRPIRDVRRAVILPDTHIPYHDEGAMAVAEAVIRMVDPHVLVHLGDLLDAGRLSTKFPTDPNRMDTLQGDIETARTKLHQWAQLAPRARRVLLEGNHEERLTRLIWGLEGANRELAKLTAFRDAMTWPHLLGLSQIGWEWVGYRDQPRDDILPHLLVKHGNFVSGEAGASAQRELKATGRSGISGHTHRAAVYRRRDWHGQATWIEAGCLCDLTRTPGVSNTPNWQQAVTVIEWSDDGALMHVEQIIIRDGRAVFRGEEISV